jgi:hypothetical protein
MMAIPFSVILVLIVSVGSIFTGAQTVVFACAIYAFLHGLIYFASFRWVQAVTHGLAIMDFLTFLTICVFQFYDLKCNKSDADVGKYFVTAEAILVICFSRQIAFSPSFLASLVFTGLYSVFSTTVIV